MTSVGVRTSEGVTIDEDADGAFVVLYALDGTTDAATIYRVSIVEEADDRWLAFVSLIPSCRGYGATREHAKHALAWSILDYLHARAAFLRDAVPLIPSQIVIETGGESHARLRDVGIPVWHVIAAMGQAVAASAHGDDTLIIAPERLAAAATALRLPLDTVRAAIAYFIEHKQEIRAGIGAESIARLDTAFMRMQQESGLSEEELAEAFRIPGDAA